VALRESRQIYRDDPSMRGFVLRYLCSLPFSTRVARTLLTMLDQTESYDDATKFGFVSSVVGWRVPYDSNGRAFISEVRSRLRRPRTAFDWLCRLVFLCKYGAANEVLTAAVRQRKFSPKEAFFARQRVAALTRGLGINRQAVIDEWNLESATGYADSASVANNLLRLNAEFPSTNGRVRMYLFPTNSKRDYPLSKFLLLCLLASRDAENGKRQRRPEVEAVVTDPWYRHWLWELHPHWFSSP